MLVVMQSHATEDQVRAVCERIESLGLKAHPIPGAARTAIGITGNEGALDLGVLESLPGVSNASPSANPTNSSAATSKQKTPSCASPRRAATSSSAAKHRLVAGPCAVETEAQCLPPPRKSPKTPAQNSSAAAPTNRALPPIFPGPRRTRPQNPREGPRNNSASASSPKPSTTNSLDLVEQYADVIQIGARNMQNFSLLKRAGRAKKPVLLKRGMSATLDEFLMAAEYVLCEGNYHVVSANAAFAPSPTSPATPWTSPSSPP